MSPFPCPDGARLCQHVAAVLYGVGARLDSQPDLFFTLRHADMQELVTAATASATIAAGASASSPDNLADEDLSALFGVDVDIDTPPAAPSKKRVAPPRALKPSAASQSLPASASKKSAAKKPLRTITKYTARTAKKRTAR